MLAVGLPTLFDEGNSGTAVAGYVLIRLATVGLWLRAAHDHPERRRTAVVYAAGVSAVRLPSLMPRPDHATDRVARSVWYISGLRGPWPRGHVRRRHP